MAKKYISNLDLGQNQLISPVFDVRTLEPIGGTSGQVYYNSTNNKPYYHNGTEWVLYGAISSVTTGQGLTSSEVDGVVEVKSLGDVQVNIPLGTTVSVDSDYQHLVYGSLTVDGYLDNDGGEVVIINGSLGGAGSVSNFGNVQFVNFATTSDLSSLKIDDLSNVVIAATPSSGDILEYNGTNWVPTSSWKKTWTWGAASAANNTTNRFLSKYDGAFTNESPYVSFYNAQIKAISIATNGLETWSGEVYVNGVSVLSLSSGGQDSAFNNTVTGVTFNAGDEISFYCNGTSIDTPSIEILIEEL